MFVIGHAFGAAVRQLSEFCPTLLVADFVSFSSVGLPPAIGPLSRAHTSTSCINVYYSHPTAALNFIDINQVGDWECLPNGKLLTHPFGHKVQNAASHQGIKASLFVAIIEITQSDTVGVCSPHPCPSMTGTPIIFLIYNISELHHQMLLKREV